MSATVGNSGPRITYTIRNLESRDVADVWETFSKEEAFATGGIIRFYDEVELEYWSHDKQALFLVLDANVSIPELQFSHSAIVGFAFVKYISPSWALLDGMYVLPAHRKHGNGKLLLDAVENNVADHGSEYLCTSVRDPVVEAWLCKQGYKSGHRYQWLEKWTKAPRTSLGRLGYDKL